MLGKLTLDSERKHVCEVQLHLQSILKAKAKAHAEYEIIRKKLPEICQEATAGGGAIDWGVEDGGWWTLQNFVIERLNNAGIEGAVNAMRVRALAAMLEDKMRL